MNFMWRTLVVMVVAAALTMPSGAAAASPRSYIENLLNSAGQILENKDAKDTDYTFTQEFDTATFARRCMIDHWDGLTEEQRKEFTNVFDANLRGQLTKMLRKVGARRDFTYKIGMLTQGKSDGLVRVPVRVIVGDVDLKFRYFVIKTDVGYRLADYEVDGILLSRNYRGRFNYMMRKYGFDGLLSKMHSKLASKAM